MNRSFLLSASLCICFFAFSGCERIMPGVRFGPEASIEVHTATSTHQRAVSDLKTLISDYLQRPCNVTIIDLPINRPEGFRWQQATVHVAVQPGDQDEAVKLEKEQQQQITRLTEDYLSWQVVGDITVVVRALQ